MTNPRPARSSGKRLGRVDGTLERGRRSRRLYEIEGTGRRVGTFSPTAAPHDSQPTTHNPRFTIYDSRSTIHNRASEASGRSSILHPPSSVQNRFKGRRVGSRGIQGDSVGVTGADGALHSHFYAVHARIGVPHAPFCALPIDLHRLQVNVGPVQGSFGELRASSARLPLSSVRPARASVRCQTMSAGSGAMSERYVPPPEDTGARSSCRMLTSEGPDRMSGCPGAASDGPAASSIRRGASGARDRTDRGKVGLHDAWSLRLRPDAGAQHSAFDAQTDPYVVHGIMALCMIRETGKNTRSLLPSSQQIPHSL
jgi:hypothetical protein